MGGACQFYCVCTSAFALCVLGARPAAAWRAGASVTRPDAVPEATLAKPAPRRAAGILDLVPAPVLAESAGTGPAFGVASAIESSSGSSSGIRPSGTNRSAPRPRRLHWPKSLCHPIDVDQAHAYLSARVVYAAQCLDRYLGDVAESTNVTARLRIRLRAEYAQLDGWQFEVPIGGLINLPALNERFNVIVDRFDRDGDSRGDLDPQEETQLAAGIQQILKWGDRMLARIDVVVRLAAPLVAQAKLRFDRDFDFCPWGLSLDQYLFYDTEDGFGATERISWTRPLHWQVLFRSISKATISESTDGVQLGQSFVFVRVLSKKDALGARAYVIGHTVPVTQSDEYGVVLSYHHCFWRDWLAVGVQPKLTWELENDYAPNPGVRLELIVDLGR